MSRCLILARMCGINVPSVPVDHIKSWQQISQRSMPTVSLRRSVALLVPGQEWLTSTCPMKLTQPVLMGLRNLSVERS